MNDLIKNQKDGLNDKVNRKYKKVFLLTIY